MAPVLIAKVFFGLFSLILISLSIVLAAKWWRLRNAQRVYGTIVDQVRDPTGDAGDAYFPVIEIETHNETVRFQSSFGQGIPFIIGSRVDVLFDQSTRNAEWYSASNVYIPIILLLLFSVPFGLLAIVIQ